MKQWKCTVCGYIHTGEAAPEKCPVCGADKSKFVLVETTQTVEDGKEKIGQVIQDAVPARDKDTGPVGILLDLLLKLHAHPISVHIPNGVGPIAVLFMAAAMIFNQPFLEIAAFCNMVILFLAMPGVIFTGYNEWRRRYGSARTNLFFVKIICAGIVFFLSFVIILWWGFDPTLASTPSTGRWGLLLLGLLLLGAAGIAGHLGSKLVFKDE